MGAGDTGLASAPKSSLLPKLWGSLLLPVLPPGKRRGRTLPGRSWGEPWPPSGMLLRVPWVPHSGQTSSLSRPCCQPGTLALQALLGRANPLILVTMRFQGGGRRSPWKPKTCPGPTEGINLGPPQGPPETQPKEWQAGSGPPALCFSCFSCEPCHLSESGPPSSTWGAEPPCGSFSRRVLLLSLSLKLILSLQTAPGQALCFSEPQFPHF